MERDKTGARLCFHTAAAQVDLHQDDFFLPHAASMASANFSGRLVHPPFCEATYAEAVAEFAALATGKPAPLRPILPSTHLDARPPAD
jgi:hypothetical protein